MIAASFLGDSALLALSGVLEDQAQELQSLYGNWCQMDNYVVQDEWVRLSGKKR